MRQKHNTFIPGLPQSWNNTSLLVSLTAIKVVISCRVLSNFCLSHGSCPIFYDITCTAFESLHLDIGLVHFSLITLLWFSSLFYTALNVSLHLTSPLWSWLSSSPSVANPLHTYNPSKPTHLSTYWHSHIDILPSCVYFGRVTDCSEGRNCDGEGRWGGGEWEGPGKHEE